MLSSFQPIFRVSRFSPWSFLPKSIETNKHAYGRAFGDSI